MNKTGNGGIVLLALLMILFSSVLPAYAGIDKDAEAARCREVVTALDTALACEQYIRCASNPHILDCFEHFVVTLVSQCHTTNLSMCEERSSLYAFVLANSDASGSAFAFDNGNYEQAVTLIELSITDARQTPYYTHFFALGVVQMVMGENEAAQSSFSESIARNFHNSLAFYFRGRIYELTGNKDQAYRDYLVYDGLASPELKVAFPLSSFRYRLPNIEHWVVYPVLSRSSGPCCMVFGDETLEPSTSVQLSILDDGAILAITGFTNLRVSLTHDIKRHTQLDFLFLRRDSSEQNLYTFTMNTHDTYNQSQWRLDLEIEDGYIEYTEMLSYFEGSSALGGVLMPEGASDPRLALESSRVCPGVPLSQIEIGDEVVASEAAPPIQVMLRTEPAFDTLPIVETDTVAPEVESGIVDGGPLCAEGLTWWHVNAGGYAGWLPDTGYFIFPRDLFMVWHSYPIEFPSSANLLGLNE